MQISPKLLSHCPLCDAAYEDQCIRLLGEHGGMRLFHLTCPSCTHAVLAVIMENQHGISSMGMVTDLEVQDAVRFRDAEPISADMCFEARDQLMGQSRAICASLLPQK